MSMRFVIALFALLLAGVPFSDAHAAADGKRVALLGTTNTNPYIGAWTSTFSKFATQAGMKVTNLNSNYDAAVQSQQVDDAIAQKFDMIVIIYVNDQAIVPALTRAKAAGIPVMLAVVPLRKEHEDLFMSYVGTDHADLGRLAGEVMVKGLQAEGKTKAQVVAVTGVAQQYNVQTRIEAFKAALAKHPGYELVANEDGKWNTALSEKITGELLVRFNARGGVDGVYGMADNQATGAIRAIESAGLKLGVANKGIVVVASNCMKDGVVNIRAGTQHGTATQIPTEEAEVAAKKVAGHFNGEKLKKYELVPVFGITKENLDQFAAGCSY
jgi:ABC-type sugar transport system substrate-binding protein